MDSPLALLWHDARLLGIDWNTWKVIGWVGNVTFFSRFIVQWYATEKRKQVVVPVAFWWLSLAGTFLLLSYALFYRSDSVFIFAYAFSWIPYARNLVIHRRHARAHVGCPGCGTECPPGAKYCCQCGTRLPAESRVAGENPG
jgi:lipid-A-disaccharide synthase-like uncharacterized protein